MFTHSDDHCQLDDCYGQRADCGYRSPVSIEDAMPMPGPVESIREWQKFEDTFREQETGMATNPETCRHWVLKKYIGYLKYRWICFSCGTNFASLPFDRKLEQYRYEPTQDCWEFIRKNDKNPVPERGWVEQLLGCELEDFQWDLLVHVLNKAPIQAYGRRTEPRPAVVRWKHFCAQQWGRAVELLGEHESCPACGRSRGNGKD